MHRTQIYLTEEQRRRIRDLARDAEVSQAEIIRRILDAGLQIGVEAAQRVAATAGILPDAPDWPMWLAAVRGDGADR